MDLLFEIGTEELPAVYLDGAIEGLRQETERLFRDAHLAFTRIEAFGTPRRLVLFVRKLESIQRHPPEEIRGPSKQTSFDGQGKPTAALTGFLKSRGGTLAQTKIVSSEKGDYVYLIKPARQTLTAQVLPQLIAQLLGRVKSPKTMRWDDSGLRFARPIRWLLALDGTRPIRVSAGRLTSARSTRIGGPRAPKPVMVTSPSGYVATLRRAGILLDQRERKTSVERLVKAAAQRQGGIPAPEVVSHGLLDEVTHLVERPVSFLGHFDRKYLTLPREVLLASMSKYQRVFAIQHAHGALLPAFVAILDGHPRNLAQVRRMYAHILNARLADSLLFWEQDQKRSLTSMAGELSRVTFHQKLGSMADKQKRLHSFSTTLQKMWMFSVNELQWLGRACRLAKADLVSTMVREFPTLQGVMGKYYALAQGEPRQIAEAIEEHYLPLAGKIPKTLVGQALSILDKYDTLASYFHIGIEPTGDQDPFGLRRAAQGIVEIAWAVHRHLSLTTLYAGWEASASFTVGAETPRKIYRYLLDRLYTFDWPKPVPSRDVIEAVLASRPDDLTDVLDRIVSLTKLDGNHALLKAAKIVERTCNILKGATVKQTEVDPGQFTEDLERQLWNYYQSNRERVLRLIRQQSYAEATAAYGEVFFDPLHEFFERVMVNVEDQAIRQNRLALMRAINVLYTDRVADLSQLAILQDPAGLSKRDPVLRQPQRGNRVSRQRRIEQD